MSKIFQLEGGQYEHPNEYKLVSTVRGTTILQPEFGTVIIEGDVIEASTHNNIQKNGVLASKVNVTMESTDTVLVPTDMTIELDLFNELKIMLLFETGTTLPSNSFIKLKETNVPIANVNDYVVNANTPLLFLYFDSKFYAYKAGEGAGEGAESLGDLSDVTLTTPTNGQALVYNGTNFVNGLQLGLVHSVIPVKSVANSMDYYTCDIEGIADFGMHNELKLQVKITATNEYNYPKIKMAGKNYQIMRFDGVQLTQVLTGQLKADNIYNLSFNGTLFVLSSGMIAEKEVKALLDTTDFQATETTNGVSKIATQSEVNEGIEDTKIVTSKKLTESLYSLQGVIEGWTSGQYVKLTQLATESLEGIIKISTTAQVIAGTDDTTAVSPAKLKELYTAGSSKTQNGYQKLPNGVILQWGTIDYNSNPGEIAVDVVFPSVFPTSCLNVTATRKTLANNLGDGVVGIVSYSSGAVTFQLNIWSNDGSSGVRGFTWFAIGY